VLRDHPRVLSGHIPSVERDIAEPSTPREQSEEGRQLGHVVGTVVGDAGGEEVGKLGASHHQGVKLEEGAMGAGSSTRVAPLLPSMEGETGAVSRGIGATFGRDPSGEATEEVREVAGRDARRPCGHGRRGGKMAEAQLAGEGG